MFLYEILDELGWHNQGEQQALVQIMSFYECNFDLEPNTKITTRFLSQYEVEAWLHKEVTLDQVNQELPEHLLRPENTESIMLANDKRLEQNPALKTQLFQYYKDLGVINEILPKQKHYDVILLLGGRQASYTYRIEYLTQLMTGPHPISGQIFLLGSDRELWATYEPMAAEILSERLHEIGKGQSIDRINNEFNKLLLETTKNYPTLFQQTQLETIGQYTNLGVQYPTEMDMMEKIYQQSEINNNQAISIKSLKHSDGARANTEDNIKDCKKYINDHNLPAKNILVISNQPHANYQLAVVKKILGDIKDINIEIAAPSAIQNDNYYNSLVINDKIAREVYVKRQIIKNK